MKIITLSEETQIDGKLYRKGEVLTVEDSFNKNLIAKTVVSDYVSPESKKIKELNSKPKPVKPKI